MTPSALRPFPIRKIVMHSACAITLSWMVGQVLKDRFLPLNFVYYIPAVVCFIAGCLGYHMLGKKSKRLRFVVLAIAFLSLAKMMAIDFAYNRLELHPEETIRFIHWNTSGGRFGVDSIIEPLRLRQPDLVLLSEAPADLEIREIARTVFENGYWFRTDGMALIGRYPIDVVERLELPDGRAWAVNLKTNGTGIHLLAVDLRANLFVDRKPDLDVIADWVEDQMTDQPLIVVGDFNTPRDSVHFRKLRENLRHAYELAGSGWPYSWPFPFPVIQTDHVWHSKGIIALQHQYVYTTGSDHLPQVFNFHLKPY